jgi:hypothetical protein
MGLHLLHRHAQSAAQLQPEPVSQMLAAHRTFAKLAPLGSLNRLPLIRIKPALGIRLNNTGVLRESPIVGALMCGLTNTAYVLEKLD